MALHPPLRAARSPVRSPWRKWRRDALDEFDFLFRWTTFGARVGVGGVAFDTSGVRPDGCGVVLGSHAHRANDGEDVDDARSDAAMRARRDRSDGNVSVRCVARDRVVGFARWRAIRAA